jgi:hypothetical protein
MEPWRAVHPVGVEQRQRRIAERGGALDQRFRKRRPRRKLNAEAA